LLFFSSVYQLFNQFNRMSIENVNINISGHWHYLCITACVVLSSLLLRSSQSTVVPVARVTGKGDFVPTSPNTQTNVDENGHLPLPTKCHLA